MSSQLSRRKWLSIALAAGFGVVTWNTPLHAKVECDPSNEYTISPQAGPWMIIVQSYAGELARDNAHKLVIELRTKYDLAAYTYNRSKEQRDQQEAEIHQRQQQQEEFLKRQGLQADMPMRVKRMRIEDQYAVLIGGYKDMDTARKALDHVKKLSAPSKELMDWSCRRVQDKDHPDGEGKIEGNYLNPFTRAFVVPNPTVKMEKPKEQPDPLMKEMNKDETYSLYKCTKPWTLVVKEFYGETVVMSKSTPTQMLEKLLGKGGPDGLNAGAMQAHEVAKVLRSHMNLEAYVLHTRYGSIVTVGAYDTRDDPRLAQNQRMLANMQLGPVIKFIPIPTPMEVPR